MKRDKFTVNLRNKLADLSMSCDSAAAIEGGQMNTFEREYIQDKLRGQMNTFEREYIQDKLREVVKFIDNKISK